MDFFEVIKYDQSFCGPGDFNGKNAALSKAEQIEFLEKYLETGRKHYKIGKTPKPVVNAEECRKILAELPKEDNTVRHRLSIDEAEAFAVSCPEYKYLTLYTKKSTENGEKIIFNDGDTYPVPCAKVETEEEIVYAKIGVNIESAYRTSLRGGVDTTVTGRIVEFRNGIKEILKIQFYSDGGVYLRLIYPDKYHHQNIRLGSYDFDTDNVLAVTFSKFCCSVSLNEGKPVSVSPGYPLLPDVVFFGGGMFPIGRWSVCPSLVLTNGERPELFKRTKKNVFEEELGRVSLPYCLGTVRYKDRVLKIKKEFEYVPDGKEAWLHISSVDPGGEVFINEEFVCRSNDLMPIDENVSNYLRSGKNLLTVYIDPRAPENLCGWHRQDDPYYGWFVGKIYLEGRNKTRIENIQISTLETEGQIVASFRAEILSDVIGDVVFSVTVERDLAKYCVLSECISLQAGKNLKLFTISFPGTPWSYENPVLYKVNCRLELNETIADEWSEYTGFRTIEQRGGKLFFNNKQITLKGALLMQYLPPHEETVLNHVCPSDEQIVAQGLMAKKMNCNTVRLHQLGYGSNDERIARIFDALGLTVIWTTRLIDSITTVLWTKTWRQKPYYQKQMAAVINHPSIIMWEGANEEYVYRSDIDNIYREFVSAVKETDTSRLVCPISHLYYANDSYDRGCQYYQDSGLEDEFFCPAKACKEWNDNLVVRSAHTYDWLLGYGTDWEALRRQPWSAQRAMLDSNSHAYIVSEYAVIGRQDPTIPEAKKFFNPESYEYGDEQALGYDFSGDKWMISQAYQALAAKNATKKMFSLGADGMLWCCLQSGANNGSYLKPPIDFWGYPKLAFYALRECFQKIICFQDDTDVLWGRGHKLRPMVFCQPDGKEYDIVIRILDKEDKTVYQTIYRGVRLDRRRICLEERSPDGFSETGYYTIEYSVRPARSASEDSCPKYGTENG